MSSPQVLKKSILTAALFTAAVSFSSATMAADLYVEPPIVQVPEVVVKQSGGWYIRGDISYDTHTTDAPMFSTTQTEVTFTSAELEDSFNLALGVGYQINENFRVDITGEYLSTTEFTGSTAGFCSAEAIAVGELNCTSVDTASFTAVKILANAYVDLGNFNGFTPYVGGGIGGAHITWSELTNVGTCAKQTVDCPVGNGYAGTTDGSTTTVEHNGTESWRFAYAFHAGASYDLTETMKLDFGYTYSAISGGDFFQWVDGSGTQGYDKGIDSHIFRAGIRYNFW